MAGVTFRGLSPRTVYVRWGLVAVAVGIVLGATAPSALGALATLSDADRSKLPWVLERLFAWLAYAALAGSVIYGLLLSTKLLDAIAHRPITFALHQDLASFAVGFAAIHGALLGLDRSIPFTLAQIVVPGLAPYAPAWVAVGQVTLYLMVAVVTSFYVRRRIGQRTWRRLHLLTFAIFIGATAHGIGAGTDSGTSWAWWSYVGASTAVSFLVAYRVVIALGRRRQVVPVRPTPPAPLATTR